MKKILLQALIVGLSLLSFNLTAGEYPDKTIKIICTDAAGGDTDHNTRLLASYLEHELAVKIEIDNEVAMDGKLAINMYKDAAPDGYTLISTNTGLFAANEVAGFEKFDSEAFVPVIVYGKQSGENIVVAASSGIKSLDDLIATARSSSQKLKFGVAMGTSSDLATMIFQKKKGAEFTLMNLGFDPKAKIKAILRKNVDVTIVPFSVAKPYIDAGRIINLATLRTDRLPAAVDVPTVKESGLPELSIDSLFVLYVPAKTDPQIIEKLNAVIHKISTENQEYRKEYREYNFQDPYVLSVKSSLLRIENQLKHILSYKKILETE